MCLIDIRGKPLNYQPLILDCLALRFETGITFYHQKVETNATQSIVTIGYWSPASKGSLSDGPTKVGSLWR